MTLALDFQPLALILLYTFEPRGARTRMVPFQKEQVRQ